MIYFIIVSSSIIFNSLILNNSYLPLGIILFIINGVIFNYNSILANSCADGYPLYLKKILAPYEIYAVLVDIILTLSYSNNLLSVILSSSDILYGYYFYSLSNILTSS